MQIIPVPLSILLCPHFASFLCVEDEVQLPSCQTTSFSGKLSCELIWPTLKDVPSNPSNWWVCDLWLHTHLTPNTVIIYWPVHETGTAIHFSLSSCSSAHLSLVMLCTFSSQLSLLIKVHIFHFDLLHHLILLLCTRIINTLNIFFLSIRLFQSRKHANKVRLYYMLHPVDGGCPAKKLRTDDVSISSYSFCTNDTSVMCL